MLDRRFATILLNGLRWGLLPVFGIAVSWAVLHFHSAALWGDFVGHFLWVTLAAMVLNWGNKEYLLRLFSQRPKTMLADWQLGLCARVVWLPLATLFFWAMFRDPWLSLELTFWTCGLFLAQSYEVCVMFQKSFAKAVWVEIVGFALTIGGIWLRKDRLDLLWLIHVFTVAACLKSLIFVVFFQKTFPLAWQRAGWRVFLTASFPFFLIGLSGLLNSRADAYVASACLGKASLGQYQVMMNLVIYVQSCAAWVLGPFVKNVYRLPLRFFQNLVWRFLLLGIAISLASVPVFWAMLRYVYGFDFDWPYFVGMFLLCLPIYGSLPLIYRLFKEGLERQVMWANFIGTALLVGLSFWLMPLLGLMGGLVASVVSQWGVWAVLRFLRFEC